MPNEWSHTAIRGLLTHHQWSVKRAEDVAEKYMKYKKRWIKCKRNSRQKIITEGEDVPQNPTVKIKHRIVGHVPN